jgi:hypothetical protein
VVVPLREVRILEVQNNGNKVPDVLDGGVLVVEMSDGRGVGGEGVGVVVLGVLIPRAGVVGMTTNGGGPLLQNIGLHTLAVRASTVAQTRS